MSLRVFSIGNFFRLTNVSESIEVVCKALRQGINYIAVAPWCGVRLAEKGMLLKTKFNIPKRKHKPHASFFCVNVN